MKIILEATFDDFGNLISAIESNTGLNDLKQQIQSAMAMQNHDQSAEVPKEGDHPVIDRFE